MSWGNRKGSALVITMLILVIMTAAGLYAVGISNSGIESVAVAEQERKAMNAADAGLYYGIDRLPSLANERGVRLPNGARYDVTVSHIGTVPAPGYDMDWAQALFRVKAVGTPPDEERIRTTAEAEVAFGPVRSGTEPAAWDGAPYQNTPLRLGPPSPFYHDLRDPSPRIVFVQRHGKRKRILLMGKENRTLRDVDAGPWASGDSNGGEEVRMGSEGKALTVSDIRLHVTEEKGMDPPDTGWRTLAVMGAGGEEGGYFAFDITDTDSGGNPFLLWEVTKQKVPILGRNPSAPAIGKVHVPDDRSDTPGATSDRWVILIGAEKGILVLEAATGRILQLLSFPGMGDVAAAPSIAFDREGYIERAYAGDLSGNLWRAVVNDTGGFDLGGGPFFSVTRGDTAKEIHGKCAIVPGEGKYSGLWIFFGTGNSDDSLDDRTGVIYALFDGTISGGDRREDVRRTTERDMVDATRFFARIDDPESEFPKRETTLSRGWYAILPMAGERMTSGPRAFFSNLFLITFQPNRKGSDKEGIIRVYGFGIAPGRNLGDPALSDRIGSKPGMASDESPMIRIWNAGVGVSRTQLVVSTGVGGIAHLSVRSTNKIGKDLRVPATRRMESVLGWRNAQTEYMLQD